MYYMEGTRSDGKTYSAAFLLCQLLNLLDKLHILIEHLGLESWSGPQHGGLRDVVKRLVLASEDAVRQRCESKKCDAELSTC